MNTQQIVQHNQDISLENVDTAKTEFCSIWPKAKEGLILLQGIIKNPIAKASIGIVIAAGDAVSKSICNN
jgi:hypothetical protein